MPINDLVAYRNDNESNLTLTASAVSGIAALLRSRNVTSNWDVSFEGPNGTHGSIRINLASFARAASSTFSVQQIIYAIGACCYISHEGTGFYTGPQYIPIPHIAPTWTTEGGTVTVLFDPMGTYPHIVIGYVAADVLGVVDLRGPRIPPDILFLKSIAETEDMSSETPTSSVVGRDELDGPRSGPMKLADIVANLERIDELEQTDAAEFGARLEPHIGAIETALANGYYGDDPTVEDRIRRRLRVIIEEIRLPTVEGGLDLAMLRSSLASLAREIAPLHADEPASPAAEAIIAAIGDDPGAEAVPARILELFNPDSDNSIPLEEPEPYSTPGGPGNRPLVVLNEKAEGSYPGPLERVALGFNWYGEMAADAVTLGAGASTLIQQISAVATAAGPRATTFQGSVAIVNILVMAIVFTWRRREW